MREVLSGGAVHNVLNARRHRRGKRCWQRATRSWAHRVLNARRHRRGKRTSCATWARCSRSAQRPKASARKTDKCDNRRCLRPSVLNARRHRRGKRSAVARCSTGEVAVLNARRHRRGKRVDLRRFQPGSSVVLNARRHRRGKRRRAVSFPLFLPCGAQRPKASARKTDRRPRIRNPALRGAQRPKASARKTGGHPGS